MIIFIYKWLKKPVFQVLLIINGKLPSWMPMVGRYLQAALIG
jgi:hypothetical protein